MFPLGSIPSLCFVALLLLYFKLAYIMSIFNKFALKAEVWSEYICVLYIL